MRDGHIAGRGDPAGDDHVERGVLKLVDVWEADPAIADERDAYAADRTGKRQAGELGGQRRRIDGDHVVESCSGSAP